MQRSVETESKRTILRFGPFELDTAAEQLFKNGRKVRLQPQPFKVLHLLASQPGKLVTREEIRAALWKDDTFIDFEQGVNFAIKQVREALGEDAERPLFIQTAPKRGYRFLAPTDVSRGATPPVYSSTGDLDLHKALWANIAELRLADDRRRKRRKVVAALMIVALLLGALFLVTIY